MEIIENTLGDVDAFLSRPLFCFLAQHSGEGPRVSPLWFLWEDRSLWHVAQLDRSYPDRVREYPETAAAIADFDPEVGRVQHVGVRGTATLEPYDGKRTDRLLRKYLGDRHADWPARFTDLDPGRYRLIRLEPDTLVARDQSYPEPGGDEAP